MPAQVFALGTCKTLCKLGNEKLNFGPLDLIHFSVGEGGELKNTSIFLKSLMLNKMYFMSNSIYDKSSPFQ